MMICRQLSSYIVELWEKYCKCFKRLQAYMVQNQQSNLRKVQEKRREQVNFSELLSFVVICYRLCFLYFFPLRRAFQHPLLQDRRHILLCLIRRIGGWSKAGRPC